MAQSVLRIEEFLAKLNRITLYGDKSNYTAKEIKINREAVNNLCKKELEYLRNNIELTTLRRYRTDYRNAIKLYFRGKNMVLTYKPKGKNEEKGHIALKYFILKKNEVTAYAESEKTRVESYLLGNKTLIDKHHQLIEIGIRLLKSTNFYEIAIGLLLMTGRRPIEILKTGSFEFISLNKVRFFGQAKVGMEGSEQTKNGYEIYTLCDAELVCKALNDLRIINDFSHIKINLILSENDLNDEKTLIYREAIERNKKIKNSTSGKLGLTLRKHLLNDDFFKMSLDGTLDNLRVIKCIEVKNLRDIWLKIAQHEFEPRMVDEHHFATRMLGHTLDSTASNYMEFMINPNTKPRGAKNG